MEKTDKPLQTESSDVKMAAMTGSGDQQAPFAARSNPDNRNSRLSTDDNRLSLSGRLDSNQRPPEPHFGGAESKTRKDKPFHGLRIARFPHFTRRIPYLPQIAPSFLQFPA